VLNDAILSPVSEKQVSVRLPSIMIYPTVIEVIEDQLLAETFSVEDVTNVAETPN
jgi:hypothetical protein